MDNRLHILSVLLLLVLVACHPTPVECWNTIYSKGDDFVFVTRDVSSVPRSISQPRLLDDKEWIPPGTKLRLRQVSISRIETVACIIPVTSTYTVLHYIFARVKDGRLCSHIILENKRYIKDREIKSLNGEHLVDLAMESKWYKIVFAPIKPGKQQAIRIDSQSKKPMQELH